MLIKSKIHVVSLAFIHKTAAKLVIFYQLAKKIHK